MFIGSYFSKKLYTNGYHIVITEKMREKDTFYKDTFSKKYKYTLKAH